MQHTAMKTCVEKMPTPLQGQADDEGAAINEGGLGHIRVVTGVSVAVGGDRSLDVRLDWHNHSRGRGRRRVQIWSQNALVEEDHDDDDCLLVLIQ